MEDAIVITQYEKICTDIELIRDEDKGLVFNFRDKVENASGRSHVFKMRKIRSAIEAARKEAKAYSLAYGRRVDALALELSSKIDSLIAPHQLAIDAVQNEEDERKAKHKKIIDRLQEVRNVASKTSAELTTMLAELNRLDVSAMEEFAELAAALLLESVKTVSDAIPVAQRREEEAAELLRLRAEKTARDEADRIEAIKRKAVEDERQQLLAEAAERERAKEVERVNAENNERRRLDDERTANERRERELREGLEKAEQELKRYKENERLDLIDNKSAIADIQNGMGGRADILREIAESIAMLTETEVAEKIAAGNVPHVFIKWGLK